MAIALLAHEVSDLTLGKPSLTWLCASSSVHSALLALKYQQEDVTEISVWDCAPGAHQLSKSTVDPHLRAGQSTCQCVGKVCMQKIICYLASEHCLLDVGAALDAPITILLDEKSARVQLIDQEASLQEALCAICRGAQNLVVQIEDPLTRCGHISGSVPCDRNAMAKMPVSSSHSGNEYCWLTHEDVLRFLLGSISVFSPITMLSIKQLGIVKTDVLMVGMNDDAISVLDKIKAACGNATAVAIVEKNHDRRESYSMIGEISCSTFQKCNETAAVALSVLSVHDFLAYIQDWRSTPGMLMDAMAAKLSKKATELERDDDECHLLVSRMLHNLEMWDASSDDELGVDSPTGPHDLLRKQNSSMRFIRSHSSPIYCRPTSSLIAVLLQALAHREHYVWVTDEDSTLVGMVTFTDILILLSNYLNLAC